MSHSPNGAMEKSISHHDEHSGSPLTKTITLSSEQFERLYLGPKNQVSGDLRKTFANPTPIALLGFSVGLTPLSIAFMGWRGAGGNAIATTTCSFWFGGILLLMAGVGEFILGNTFPMMVFIGYGAHFLTFATLFIPWFNAVGFFTPTTQGTPGEGLMSPQFAASFAYYPIALCILSIIFLIGSLRTNLVFVLIFIFASIGFGCGAGGFFHLSTGNTVVGNKLIVGLGACFFAACILGWYLTLAATITIMELPIPDLPVFDLSTVIKARPRGGIKEE